MRSYNCLKRAGINTVHDLTEKSEADDESTKSWTQEFGRSETQTH